MNALNCIELISTQFTLLKRCDCVYVCVGLCVSVGVSVGVNVGVGVGVSLYFFSTFEF